MQNQHKKRSIDQKTYEKTNKNQQDIYISYITCDVGGIFQERVGWGGVRGEGKACFTNIIYISLSGTNMQEGQSHNSCI